MNDHNTSDKKNKFDIALIGISARFPGVNSIDEFWQYLRDGVESISRFTDEVLIDHWSAYCIENQKQKIIFGTNETVIW